MMGINLSTVRNGSKRLLAYDQNTLLSSYRQFGLLSYLISELCPKVRKRSSVGDLVLVVMLCIDWR